jgi:hypothetical protein
MYSGIIETDGNEEPMTDDLFHTARQMPRQLRQEANRLHGDDGKTSLTYRAADVIEVLLRALVKEGAA